MIKYHNIYEVLLKTDNNTPIKIKRWGGDLLTVYITHIKNDIVWARHYNEQQDVRIFPTKQVEILKIGSNEVQSKADYDKDIEDILAYEKEKNIEFRKQMYRDAARKDRQNKFK